MQPSVHGGFMVSLVVLARARERHTDSDTRLAGFANDYRLPNWVLPCPQDDTGHTADERESGPLERRSGLYGYGLKARPWL